MHHGEKLPTRLAWLCIFNMLGNVQSHTPCHCIHPQAVEILSNRGFDDAACGRLLDQMAEYKAGAGVYAQPHGGEDFSPRVWWLAMAGQQNKEICNIGVMLATITPHAADPERCFSYAAWFKSKQRNRLGVGILGKLLAIKTHHTERKAAPTGTGGAAGTGRAPRSATMTSGAPMQVDPSLLVEEQTEEEPSTGEEVAEQLEGVGILDGHEVEVFRLQQISSVEKQVEALTDACNRTLACMAARATAAAAPEEQAVLLQQQKRQEEKLKQLQEQLSALRGDNLSFQGLLYSAWDGFDLTSCMYQPTFVPPRSTGAQTAATLGLVTGGGTRMLTAQEIVRLHAAGAGGGRT